MQEAISTQSPGRLSRLGRILPSRHFFPELPIQWPPRRMKKRGGGARRERVGRDGRGGITAGRRMEEGREDESKEGEEKRRRDGEAMDKKMDWRRKGGKIDRKGRRVKAVGGVDV